LHLTEDRTVEGNRRDSKAASMHSQVPSASE